MPNTLNFDLHAQYSVQELSYRESSPADSARMSDHLGRRTLEDVQIPTSHMVAHPPIKTCHSSCCQNVM